MQTLIATWVQFEDLKLLLRPEDDQVCTAWPQHGRSLPADFTGHGLGCVLHHLGVPVSASHTAPAQRAIRTDFCIASTVAYPDGFYHVWLCSAIFAVMEDGLPVQRGRHIKQM